MRALGTPVGAWSRHRGILLLGLTVLLAALLLGPARDVVSPRVGVHGLLVGTATLAASVFLYLHRRVTGTTGWRLQGLPAWARAGIVVGALVLVVGSVVGAVVGGVVGGVAAPGSSIVGSILLAGTAAAVLQHAIDEEKREVNQLNLRLQTIEAGARVERARLHEINATVAGIASAQTLMTEGLGSDDTDALAAMMRAEVQRLQRLVADRGPTRRRNVDLDDTIGQIVLSHLARGRVVIWEPTGLRAQGRADAIAEIVNVLLDNAAVHGGPDAVSVRVTRDDDGGGVAVTVTDQGPGVPPALGDRIFDWGVSRPGSPGQGIGLHVAADVARELGGRLDLLPTATGATFQLSLPAAQEEEVVVGEHDARAS
jgi:signal transduction histidine kinase